MVHKSKNGPNHPKKDTQLLPLPKRLFQAHPGPCSHTSGFGVLLGSPPPELSNSHWKPVDTNFSASSSLVAGGPAPRDGAVALGRPPLPAPWEKALTTPTRLPQQNYFQRPKPGKGRQALAPQLQPGRDFSCPPLLPSHLALCRLPQETEQSHVLPGEHLPCSRCQCRAPGTDKLCRKAFTTKPSYLGVNNVITNPAPRRARI